MQVDNIAFEQETQQFIGVLGIASAEAFGILKSECGPPPFNRREIDAHVSLLHDLAEGCDGILVLAGFEERGVAKVQRFRIGDVNRMTDAIMAYEKRPRFNLYIPWCTLRNDLEPNRKGSESDVISVLATVGDLDNDKYQLGELPIAAPYIVETSPGNYQPFSSFSRPLSVKDAKPVLTALSDFIGGDTGTKDASHIWRRLRLPQIGAQRGQWRRCHFQRRREFL
jgi:RepB DNA-primase from phage plasmid